MLVTPYKMMKIFESVNLAKHKYKPAGNKNTKICKIEHEKNTIESLVRKFRELNEYFYRIIQRSKCKQSL